MKPNWFAVNRSIERNELFMDKPLWGWAWVIILGRADYQTGQVCLTDCYRALKRHFGYQQWRHMLRMFEREGMIEIEKTENLGSQAGHRMVAQIVRWSEYQPAPAKSQQQSQQRANNRASKEPSADQNEAEAPSTKSEQQSQQQSQQRANNSVYKEYKEVKKLRREEGEAARAREHTPTTPNHPPPPKETSTNPNTEREHYSSEEAAFEMMNGRGNPRNTSIQARDFFRKLCGNDFVNRYADDLRRWYVDHGEDKLREFWQEAETIRPEKRRIWNMADLCSGDLTPPPRLEFDFSSWLDQEPARSMVEARAMLHGITYEEAKQHYMRKN